MSKYFTDMDKEYIRANAGVLTDKQIAADLTNMLNREISVDSVSKARQRMGIAKLSGRGKCQLAKHAAVGAAVSRPSHY